jgi:hypothetical protein
MALARQRAGHRQADHAGANDKDLHATFCPDQAARYDRRHEKVKRMELEINHHLHKNRG